VTTSQGQFYLFFGNFTLILVKPDCKNCIDKNLKCLLIFAPSHHKSGESQLRQEALVLGDEEREREGDMT
jgi:hypothetical protein